MREALCNSLGGLICILLREVYTKQTSMPSICVIGESDPFIAQLLQRFAEKTGLHVERGVMSQDVLDLIRRVNPAVVILDAELPGSLLGWEAIRILRAETKTSTLRVISCSWLNKAKAARLMGPLAGHLQKPDLYYEDFIAAVQNAGIMVNGLKDMN
jgi:CheY-like chemotaxis protein